MSSFLRQLLSSSANQDDIATNETVVRNSAGGVGRYKHDLKQAQASHATATTLSGSRNSSSSKRRLSPLAQDHALRDDMILGFKGLDEAEAHRKAGKLESSLKMYELSIELLIRVLKDTKAPADGKSVAGGSSSLVDTSSVEARVESALAQAERIKALLVGKGQASNSAQSTYEPTGETSQSFRSLSNALKSAVRVDTKRSTFKQPPQHSPVSSGSSSPLTRQGSGRTDELAETILSDFLVDARTLQQTTWEDISGLEKVKQSLQESAILPLMRPDLFSGLRKPQNILLYGPPGTGKTMLVRAVAQESGSSLFCVTAATLTSKWMGESEKLVRSLFAVAHQMAPSIVYVDEVDSLLSARKSEGEHEASRRLKTEFMVQMDGISNHKVSNALTTPQHVLVLACTNCPWDLDAAILRRFPRRIYVPLPDVAAREGLLQNLLKKAGKHSLTPGQISQLTQRLEGYSCSDLTAIAAEASFGPLRSVGGLDKLRNVKVKDVRPISLSDFESALSQTSKSVTPALLSRYEDWRIQASA